MSVKVRFVHNVAKGVDVVIRLGEFKLGSFLTYKRSTPYFEFPQGQSQSYDLTLSTRRGKELYQGKLELISSKAYTSIIHGVEEGISVLTVEDNLDCPKRDKTNVRVIHAAYGVSPVNVYYNDKVVYSQLSFGNVGNPPYYSFPVGKADFTLVKPSTIRPVAGPYSIDLGSQLVYTMIVSGTENNVSLIISEDSQKFCIQTEE